MTFFRSPLLAGANVLFGVVAGVFAAAFHEDLVDSTPLIWVFRGTEVPLNGINARAASFWSFLLLFASIWVVREWVAANDRRNEVEQLEALIETVPPPNFLQEFKSAFKQVVTLLRTAGRESIDFETIRLVLDQVIALSAGWDYRTSKTTDVYRANVMLNIGTPPWDATLAAAGAFTAKPNGRHSKIRTWVFFGSTVGLPRRGREAATLKRVARWTRLSCR